MKSTFSRIKNRNKLSDIKPPLCKQNNYDTLHRSSFKIVLIYSFIGYLVSVTERERENYSVRQRERKRDGPIDRHKKSKRNVYSLNTQHLVG